MALTTLGSGDTTSRVEETIQRRGADGTSMSTVWTSLAAAGGVLAIIALFVTWYANDTISLDALHSGWMPTIALVLVLAGAALLIGREIGLIPDDKRVDSDLFTYSLLGAAAVVLILRQLIRGDLDSAVYLLVVPLFGLVLGVAGVRQGRPVLVIQSFQKWAMGLGAIALIAIIRQLVWKNDVGSAVSILFFYVVVAIILTFAQVNPSGTTLAIEQVALAFASVGALVIVLKRMLDSTYATSGWAWGLIAAVAVVAAALAACQYLGILSFFQVVLFVALAISTLILVVLLVQVIGDGWPVLSERLDDFWNGTLRSRASDDGLGLSQGVIGSLWIAAFVAGLAFPIGIAAAVYLEEYAPRDPMSFKEATAEMSLKGWRAPLRRWFWSRVTSSLDIIVRNLAGVPSVVYGLLGLFLFVKSAWIIARVMHVINWFWAPFHNFIHDRSGFLRDGRGLFEDSTAFSAPYENIIVEPGQSSLFAGGVTLAILVLPIVIITAAEAIRAVPQSLREGAFGVGATKWEVIRGQVLPFAAPGILTGTLLALSRAVGEAAPLILVGAITGRLAPRDSMFEGLDALFGQFADRFTAIPIVIVGWVQNSGRDAGFGPAAGAAIIVLLVFVILMNSIAVLLRNYFEKKRA